MPLDPPPLQRLIRRRDLRQFVGLGASQIAELIKAGEFPKPVPLSNSGRAVAWLESDLLAWQLARIARRDAVQKRAADRQSMQGEG